MFKNLFDKVKSVFVKDESPVVQFQEPKEFPFPGEKPMKVVFADSFFEGFEGTDEELEAIMADIKAKVEDGSFFQDTHPLTEEEMEELNIRLGDEFDLDKEIDDHINKRSIH